MKTSSKWIIGIAAALTIVGGGRLVAYALVQPTTVEVTGDTMDPTPGPAPTSTVPPAALPDGTIDGYISIDPSSPGTIAVDTVEILTGQAAHDAAVEAGIITEDEDLPNDMYIANDDRTSVPLGLHDDAGIEMVSGDTPGTVVSVTAGQLAELYEGSYDGPAVYGVVAGQPILMSIAIEGGSVTQLQAVYLP